MATLKYIKELKNSGLLLLGVAEEGESAAYTVNRATYEAVGIPLPPVPLTDDQLCEIRYTDSLIRAKKKALSLLALADNNRRTLYTKLIRAGFSREISEIAVSEMISLGYVNEQRQLERIILNEANIKLRGPGKIIPSLVNKGFSASDVRAVLSRLVEEGKIDFDENKKALLDKKLSGNSAPDQVKKILYSNGFKI